MQAGAYSWRGGEGSQTDLNGDDRKPPERVHDPRYPENPNAFCCDEGEDTAAVARSQPATGFVYMVNRLYEPETGRFTQADKLPFDPTQLTNAQNNRWTYCGSDPVNLSDPHGLGVLVVIAIIIAIISLLLGGWSWWNWYGTAASSPRRVIIPNGEYEGDCQALDAVVEGFGDALPPGTSFTGMPGVPTDNPEAVLEVFFWLYGWSP